jgi:hypothetical protein
MLHPPAALYRAILAILAKTATWQFTEAAGGLPPVDTERARLPRFCHQRQNGAAHSTQRHGGAVKTRIGSVSKNIREAHSPRKECAMLAQEEKGGKKAPESLAARV